MHVFYWVRGSCPLVLLVHTCLLLPSSSRRRLRALGTRRTCDGAHVSSATRSKFRILLRWRVRSMSFASLTGVAYPLSLIHIFRLSILLIVIIIIPPSSVVAPRLSTANIALVLVRLFAYNTQTLCCRPPSFPRYPISILVMTANDLFAFFLSRC